MYHISSKNDSFCFNENVAYTYSKKHEREE